MGKANQGVFGQWRNKVGNVVGRVLQGQQIYSIYQPVVANPRTTAQESNRAKFRILAQFFKLFASLLKISFAGTYTLGSGFTRAMKVNFANGTSGTYPNQQLALANLVIGQGQCPMVYNPAAAADAGVINLSWTDNSETAGAEETDKMYGVAYNTVKKEVLFESSMANRADSSMEWEMPTAWSGDTVAVYIGFARKDMGGNSVYLGTLSI